MLCKSIKYELLVSTFSIQASLFRCAVAVNYACTEISNCLYFYRGRKKIEAYAAITCRNLRNFPIRTPPAHDLNEIIRY